MPPSFDPDVASFLAKGQLWRAKELLSGRMATYPFSPRLCEQYGAVLLHTGDMYQAGKYLFLSGVRLPEYDEAIEVFLSRSRRAGAKSVIGILPGRVRKMPLSDLPEVVTRELQGLEALPTPPPARLVQADSPDQANKDIRAFLAVGCVLALAFILASIAAGIPVVFRTLASWFNLIP